MWANVRIGLNFTLRSKAKLKTNRYFGAGTNVMAHEIKESDWKVFRRLHGIALERFCQRVVDEVRSVSSECSDSYHDCFLRVYALIQGRNKDLARAFDDLRRSNAFILLANIKEEGLLSEEELLQFSPEAREVIERIDSIRRG